MTTSPATEHRGLPIAEVLAFAALLEVFLQSARAFFPLGYHLVGPLGFILTPAVLLPVFAAGLLAPLVWRRPLGRSVILPMVAVVALGRVLLQAIPVLPVAAVSTLIGVLALTVLLPRLAGGRFGPDVIASGTLVGFGIDIALRAWRATDDVVWSSGWAGWLDPSLWGPLALLVMAVGFIAREPVPPRAAPGWTWALLLVPQLLLWSSLGFVGSSAGVSLGSATAVLVLSVAVAMAVLALPQSRLPWPVPAAAVLLSAAVMPWVTGWPVLALAALAVVAVPLLVRAAAVAARGRRWSPWRAAGAATCGWLLMFGLLVLYPLHYEITLPLDNGWLPAIAVLLAVIPLLRSARVVQPYVYASPSPLHIPALVITTAAAPALGLAVQSGMVGGSPLPGPDPRLAVGAASEGGTVIATYNTGQGQNADTGALAFRETAELIVGLDADVVALQEVARGWPLTGMADFGAWLAANTDFEIYYAPAADNQFGNALVSRLPLRDVTVLDLGQQGGAQRRSAIRAALPDGTTVYGIHLQARNSAPAEASRLSQMEQIVADWDGRPRTVLAGDLNPRNEYPPGSDSPPKVISNLQVFLDAGFETTQPTELCTEPTSNDNCSDYLFHTSDLPQIGPTEVLPETVSDHRPVVARLR